MEIKGAIAAILLTIAVVGGHLPLFLASRGANQRVVTLCNSVAGGVLLAAALVHMLPQAERDLANVGWQLQQWAAPNPKGAFAVAPVFCGLMFFLLAAVEVFVQSGAKDERDLHGLSTPLASESRLQASNGETQANPMRRRSSSGSTGHLRGCLRRDVSGLQGAVLSVILVAPECLTAQALVVALMIHSLLEGLGIGAQQNITSVMALFVAVGAHKGLAAFALGSQLLGTCTSRTLCWSVTLFAACSPLGIILGSLLASEIGGAAVGAMLAMAAGTFLYVGVPELLMPAFENTENRRSCVLAAVVGFVSMALLALWC